MIEYDKYIEADFTEKLTAKDIHTLCNLLNEVKGWLTYYSVEEFEKLIEAEPDIVGALNRLNADLADYAHSCRWYIRKLLATSPKFEAMYKEFEKEFFEQDYERDFTYTEVEGSAPFIEFK
jgi:hypothetical protein